MKTNVIDFRKTQSDEKPPSKFIKFLRTSSDEDLKKMYKILGYKYINDVVPKYETPIEQYNIPFWYDLPNFECVKERWGIFNIYFDSDENIKEFEKKLNMKFQGKSGWYPTKPRYSGDTWITEKPQNPKYPIFIISKGRWEKRWTQKALEEMKVDYKIVIEPQEYDNYVEHIPSEKILILPNEYLNKNQGSIPVRNFIWEYSKKQGHKRHWCLDDNIDGFYRFHKNARIKVKSGVCFKVLEDYTDRFSNVGLTGMNYFMFCPDISKRRLLAQVNTRVYSCILIDNSLPERWRGTYNEDTDLSLRLLKRGVPTLLFNMFLCNKKTTMTCKGGNTDTIYKDDGLEKKTMSLVNQHPDCVKKTFKFGKIHHQVDYRGFKDNKLKVKPDQYFSKNFNEYTMKLI